MLTPQEVSGHGFTKVSFGGYNMVQVDEFLDLLTGDYSNLYVENTALKRKIKVMQDKIDEYRDAEETVSKALLAAQQIAENMVQEGKAKTQKLMDDAHSEIEAMRQTTIDAREQEERRLEEVRHVTAQYVEQVRALHRKEQDYLDSLGVLLSKDAYEMDYSTPAPVMPQVPPQAAPVPAPQQEPPLAYAAPQMPQQPQVMPQQPAQVQPVQQPVVPTMQQPVAQQQQQPMQPVQPPQPQQQMPNTDHSGMGQDVKQFIERAMADARGEQKGAELAEEGYPQYQPQAEAALRQHEEYVNDPNQATTRFFMGDDLEQQPVGSREIPTPTVDEQEYDAELAQPGNRSLDFSRLQQEFGHPNHNNT